ncbi:hypothetical protein RJT34_16020 [Clitoria ternatea]|uniref:Uncharacterized protein n=1 Tax=Clitoria ternatea TaxID=43366 RepID=A0AAN9J7L4_CLITE
MFGPHLSAPPAKSLASIATQNWSDSGSGTKKTHANHPARSADTQVEDDGNPLEPTNSPDRSHQGGSNPVRVSEAKLASEDPECPRPTKESLRKSPTGTHYTNLCLNKTASQGNLSSDHFPQLSTHRPLSPKRPTQICSHNLPNLVQDPSMIPIHIPRAEPDNSQFRQNLPHLQNKLENTLENGWNKAGRKSDPWEQLLEHYTQVCNSLQSWNKATFRNSDLEIARLQHKLENLINERTGNYNGEQAEAIKQQIDQIREREEIYWAQRSRVQWLQWGGC